MIGVQELILYCSLFTSLFFEVFLLITYLEVREELKVERKSGVQKPTFFPTVTIIVPCFNEEHTVANTLRSLLRLDYPKDKLSIIAVDDGSTDRTRRELAKFEKSAQFSVLSQANGGKHTALNLALKKVKSDLVGCLDADSFVNSDALHKIVPFFDKPDIMAVIPSIRVHEPQTILQYLQKIEYSWGIFLRRMLSSLGAIYVTPGPFSIFRTRVFHELGGYRSGHNTEDLEFALRMQRNHYKIVNSHSAHVYTVTPRRLPALCRQRVRWTYGFLNNCIDYREMFFNRKYGNLGLFVLPIGIISIFSFLYIIGTLFWNNMVKISNTIVRLQTIGFTSMFQFPSFDWYFINTGSTTLLSTITLFLTLTILFLSLKLTDGKVRITRGIFYYFFLYGLIAPLWLTKAVFDTVVRKQTRWR